MKTYDPLFITGVARGGTNLVSRILNAHELITIALDPFFPLFRSLRNALVSRSGLEELMEFRPEIPLQDYYFTSERIRILDAIQSVKNDVPFNSEEWPELLERLSVRTGMESPDLVLDLPGMLSTHYGKMFDKGMEIIASARNCRKKRKRWVGIKEVWIVEFFTFIAEMMPDARFIIIMRDPRAVVSSMLGFREKDPSQVANTLSFIRHWRKYVAFIEHFQHGPFSDRLHVLTFERLVADPENTAKELCRFLDVPYDPSMIDTERFVDVATGGAWKGNSTFEDAVSGISRTALDRWRTKLAPDIMAMIDYICGPDMELCGYHPGRDFSGMDPASDIIDYLVMNNNEPSSWRSDFNDPQQDFGCELFRKELLRHGGKIGPDLIRRSFLFESLYEMLRKKERPQIVS